MTVAPLQKDARVPPANLGRLGFAAVIQRELGVSQRAALRLVDAIRGHMSAAEGVPILTVSVYTFATL